MDDIKQILLNLGFSNISDLGKEYRAKPIYRDSDSSTVMSVKKDTGYFVDYARGLSGPLEKLVELCLGCSSADAKKWLESDQGFIVKKRHIYDIPAKKYKTLSQNAFDDVIRDNSYWLNRGISEETISVFDGGVFEKGRMKNRYTFPIYDSNKKLIGVSGRYIYNIKEGSRVPKWKHIGEKSKWQHPTYFNSDILKEKDFVIVVESIGDMLSLWDAGYKNVLVSFGLDLSFALINSIIKYDIDKIVLAFNNDENLAGNNASQKCHKKLLKFFDEEQVQVCLPTKNDFGEMTDGEIELWAKKIK
tara:strand:+ start:8163 stop:9071 length:909 start_codon:yes stop_codon:yes gene_type:complete